MQYGSKVDENALGNRTGLKYGGPWIHRETFWKVRPIDRCQALGAVTLFVLYEGRHRWEGNEKGNYRPDQSVTQEMNQAHGTPKERWGWS